MAGRPPPTPSPTPPPTPSPEGFFFDLDGTLTESQAGIVRCFRAALEALGVTDLEDRALRGQVGAPLPEVLAAFCPGLGEAELARGIAAYRAVYERAGIFDNTLYPGVHAMLARIRESGRPAWVVTAKPRHYAERVVDILGIRDLLGGVMGPGLEEHDTKTVLLARALQGAGLAPGAAVMLGDRHYDVTGALENGVRPVGALWGYGARAELADAGCRAFAETAEDFTRRYVV